MKKAFIQAVCLFFLGSFAFAQSKGNMEAAATEVTDTSMYAMPVFDKEIGTDAIVFVDKTKLRSAPNLSADVVAELPEFSTVHVNQDAHVITDLQERSARWYRVTAGNQTGYLWSGNLASRETKVGGKTLLFAVTGTESNMVNGEPMKNLVGELKLIDKGTVLSSLVFNAGNSENLASAELQVEKAYNLTNVNYIINVSIGGEACGIPTYVQYAFVKGDEMVGLPRISSTGDADIFYHEEKFKFPDAKSKTPNQFLQINEEGVARNPDSEHIIMDGYNQTINYSWDGSWVKKVSSSKKEFKGRKS